MINWEVNMWTCITITVLVGIGSLILIFISAKNFKKRSSKERDMLYNSLISDIVKSLLPDIDNLEKAASATTADENYKQGVELVLKQFLDVLTANGVSQIETVGKTFDPELHEAVSSVVDENLGEKEIYDILKEGSNLETRKKIELIKERIEIF